MNIQKDGPTSISELEEAISRPTDTLIKMMTELSGDILILGAGGKMGPSLSVMARRASDMAGTKRRVIAVSRFSNSNVRDYLINNNVDVFPCELLAPDAAGKLPDAENIVYMAGMKFGANDNPAATWAINAGLPALINNRFLKSRIVIFSTGNIYGLSPLAHGGSKESDTPRPDGEYAMSALGRERVFEYYSRIQGTKQSVIRLNYACDLRYGVLVDIALNVFSGRPVHLKTGYLNTIWQGDANAMALSALLHAASPPMILNVTGRQTLRVREVAAYFGQVFGKQPVFEGEEAGDALLSDSSLAETLFGSPQVDETQIMEWVTTWIKNNGPLLNKPTRFESRNGLF